MADVTPPAVSKGSRLADWIFARLSRVTTSGRIIPEIDGLRFVAIALVVLVHVHHYVALLKPGKYDPAPALDDSEPNPILRAFNHGDVGVLLFFVISGFILALPFAEARREGKRVPLGRYLLRRVTRLEPPYLISLMLLFPLSVLFSMKIDLQEGALSAVASSLYLHGIIFGEKPAINFVTWSLEVEVQFYLLVPLLAKVFAVRAPTVRRIILMALAAGLIALQEVGGVGKDPRLSLTVLNYGQYFLAGFLLADIYLADWNERPSRSAWWDLVWVVGWPLLFAVAPLSGRSVLLPILLAALFVAALRGKIVRWCLSCRWVVVIGGMCYSIYLIHISAISAIGRLTMRLATGDFVLDFILQFALLAAPIVVAGAAYFAVIERPCMRRDWPQRLWATVSGWWDS